MPIFESAAHPQLCGCVEMDTVFCPASLSPSWSCRCRRPHRTAAKARQLLHIYTCARVVRVCAERYALFLKICFMESNEDTHHGERKRDSFAFLDMTRDAELTYSLRARGLASSIRCSTTGIEQVTGSLLNIRRAAGIDLRSESLSKNS